MITDIIIAENGKMSTGFHKNFLKRIILLETA